MTTAVTVDGVSRRYGDTVALDDVDLTVERGEILGILGRNGAGKTTLVETIAGLRAPDRGEARVFGLDPRRDRARVRQILSVQLQESVVHFALQVHELVRLHRSFYPDGHDPDALIERLGLNEARRTRYESLSGGQQQRLSIALALVGKPRVVILDELSTGLDPEGRRGMWEVVDSMRTDGVTVILVSHAMDEVARLCDRVTLLDHGRILAGGTPDELVAQADADNLESAFLTLTSASDASKGTTS